MENQYDEDFRAMNFCKNMLKQVPEMKEMFDKISEAMDELMELNKDLLEDLGRRLVRAYLGNTTIFSEDPSRIFRYPNLVFQQAVEKASQHIAEFSLAVHEKRREKVLKILDGYWEEAKKDMEEVEGMEEA